MADKPLTAADIVAGRSPFGKQEVKPYDDPTWAGQFGHLAEQGASGLGAGPVTTQKAGDVGSTIGGILGSMSLHDVIPNLTEAYQRIVHGQPLQAIAPALSAIPIVPGAGAARTVARSAAKDVANTIAEKAVPQSMADVPSLRGLPVDQAIEAARAEPHLIPAGNVSKGYYIGGPQDVQSPADLAARRAAFDQYIAPEQRGWDWYDRYRAGMNRATGGDPTMNQWMSNAQGSWSAGVSPESETAFAIKEANSALAGQPARAYMGGAHEDFLNANRGRRP